MNGRDEATESALRTALHDAAAQIAVRRTALTTADDVVESRRGTRRARVVRPIAACLALALALGVGGWLLFSASDDPIVVQTPGSRGCAGRVYIAINHPTIGEGAVLVIDTATGKVSAPITVGKRPRGIAITPDGEHAYVTNKSDGTVSVITTATEKVSATINVGRVPRRSGTGPGELAIAPDGKHVYVANGGAEGRVSVIDTTTGKVSAQIKIGGAYAGWLAIAPDGKHVYVATSGSGDTLSVIDTTTEKVAHFKIGGGPYSGGSAITPDGKHLYAISVKLDPVVVGTVSVIDTATGKVSARINIDGSVLNQVAIAPDGKHAYVKTAGLDSALLVIDTATGAVSAPIALAENGLENVGDMAVTPDGKHAYVTNDAVVDGVHEGTMSVIDTATGAVSARISVGNEQGGYLTLAICPARSTHRRR